MLPASEKQNFTNFMVMKCFSRQYSYALTASPTTHGMFLPPKATGYLPVTAAVAPALVPDVLPYQPHQIVNAENYRTSNSRRRGNSEVSFSAAFFLQNKYQSSTS